MDLVRHKTNVDGVDKIQSFFAQHKDGPPEWQTSQMYSSKRQEKFIDEDLRQSSFQLFEGANAKPLFALMEHVVQQFNADDAKYHYMLRHNDITHIRYQTGGFFKRHRDYLSTTSNLLEEFTLIVCVTPEDIQKTEGGDTMLFTYGEETGKAFDTHTPGCALLFRKDMEHEGQEVKAGKKHIVTANLWATRKAADSSSSSQVLLVTFPSDSKEEARSSSRKDDAATAAIQRAACAETSHVLPASVAMQSGVLQTHIEWANRQAEQNGSPLPGVIEYPCTNFDFETFGTLVKVLKRAHVSETSLLSHAECLDFFGPFPTEHLLVDLAVEEQEAAPSGKKKARVEEEEEGSKEEPKQATTTTAPPSVIVCENEARTKAVMEVARLFHEPYVPFKMMFVEGMMNKGGEWGPGYRDVPMTCTLCLVGEYNNVFSIQGLARKENEDYYNLVQQFQKFNYWNLWKRGNGSDDWLEDLLENHVGESAVPLFPNRETAEEFENNRLDTDRFFEDDYYQRRDSPVSLRLVVGYGPDSVHTTTTSTRYVFSSNGREWPGPGLFILPGNDNKKRNREDGTNDEATAQGSNGSSEGATAHPSPTPPLFHRDDKGWTVFSREEAERASEFIHKLNLQVTVKASLQKTQFDLPQQSGYVDANFCNETVYGSLNVLWVSGVIRLEDDPAREREEVGCDNFNVWPSAQQIAETDWRRAEVRKEMGPDDEGSDDEGFDDEGSDD